MVQFLELGPMFPTGDEVSPDSFALFTGWSFVHIFTGIIIAFIALWLLPNRIVLGSFLSFVAMGLWEFLEWWWERDDVLMSKWTGTECTENRIFDVFVGMSSYFTVLFFYFKYFNHNDYNMLSM